MRVPSDTSCSRYHICIECASRAGTGDRSPNAGLEAFAGPVGATTSSRRRLLSVMHLGGLTFREVCLRTWARINDHEILTRAAAISFYALAALVPFLALVITLSAWVPARHRMGSPLGQAGCHRPGHGGGQRHRPAVRSAPGRCHIAQVVRYRVRSSSGSAPWARRARATRRPSSRGSSRGPVSVTATWARPSGSKTAASRAS